MDTNQLKILVIDDQRDNLTTLEAVLTDALPGCILLTAMDGPRGITLAREADPDAILLDIGMPDMDGFEVCRRLKADERLREIPVIILTAQGTDRATRVGALEAGAEAFLSKPVDDLELVAQLRAMARLKTAHRMRRLEHDELAALVGERTQHLEQELAARRRADQELAQIAALLEHAGEMARVGGWELDVASGRLRLSKEAARIHEVEFSEEPLLVAQGGEYYSPEVWPVVRDAVQAAIEQGTAYDLEVPFMTAKGHHLWVHVTGFAVRENGKTVKLRGLFQDITERKRAEDALRERERRLQKIFDILPIGMWFADKTGKLLMGNSAGVKIWGAEPRVDPSEYGVFKARRLPSGEEIAPDDWALAHTIREGTTTLDELLEIDAFDGRKRIILNFTGPVLDDDGAVLGAVILNQDVTEQKQAEAALRESEKRFRLLFEKAPLGYQSLDSDGKFLEINQTWLETLGYTREEVIGHWFGEFLAPDFVEGFRTRFPLFKAAGKIHSEFEMLHKNGHRLDIAFEGRIAYELDGEFKQTHCVLQDITEQKQAEAALQRSDALQRKMISNIGDVIVIIDENGINRYKSENVEKFFGWKPEEVVGVDALANVHPDDLDAAQAFIMDLLKTPSATGNAEVRYHCKDGSYKWIHFTGCNLLNDPDIHGILGNYRDITDQKKMEAERERLEDQLRASQKMEAIGGLAGGVAHDFNNLLSVILSYTGFAMDAVRDGDQLKDDLLEVKNAAERAAALTRQLLAFSRKQVLQPVALDLNQVATGVEKMLRRILGEDIELVLTLAPDLGLTLADPGQIEQVLMNLVVNARDAMPTGGQLTIETANVEIDDEYAARHVAVKPGSFVQLTVSDTGCGMDERTREHLFEPFFTTKEKGKGTGLGLSTVYGIVQQSGGSIWVYSEQGQGTTFKVYLPRERSATTATVVTPPTVPMRSTGTETILVVEDEEALRKVARRSLEAAGYQVLTAADGDEALLKSIQHAGEIHLLLTDVVMPRMGGRAVAQALLKTRPTVRVVYMSGYTDNAIGHHGALEAGTHFLAKPFTSTALKEKVRAVLDTGALFKR